MQSSDLSEKLVRISSPVIATLAPSQDTTSDQLAWFYRPSPIPFTRHSPLPVAAEGATGAHSKSIAQTQAGRTIYGVVKNLNQIPVSTNARGTQNSVNLSDPAIGGGLTSLKINTNVTSNFTNNATVDSIDNGTNATIRAYGPGGVGTTWHQQVSTQVSQEYPAFSGTGAYTTQYAVMFNPLTGVFSLNTNGFATLPDGLIFVGNLTTVAAGGGGGSSGGGGGSGHGTGGGGHYQ